MHPQAQPAPQGGSASGSASRALVVANPHARRVRSGEWRKATERVLGRRYGVEIVEPESTEAASALVRDRVANDQPPAMVIAVGGDGTVRVVAEALSGTGIPMGVIPLGTGNDFARSNGIPEDVGDALKCIVRRSTRAVDLLEVNGKQFLTAGGTGVGAHSALFVPWVKALHPLARIAADSLGTGIYRVAAGATVMFRPELTDHIRLTWSAPGDAVQQTLEIDAYGVFVANQRTLGGGMALPVEADNADGALDLCVVHPVARVRLLAALVRLLRGATIAPDVFSTYRADRATIETSRPTRFFGCGELVAEGTRFDVRTIAGGLRVLC